MEDETRQAVALSALLLHRPSHLLESARSAQTERTAHCALCALSGPKSRRKHTTLGHLLRAQHQCVCAWRIYSLCSGGPSPLRRAAPGSVRVRANRSSAGPTSRLTVTSRARANVRITSNEGLRRPCSTSSTMRRLIPDSSAKSSSDHSRACRVRRTSMPKAWTTGSRPEGSGSRFGDGDVGWSDTDSDTTRRADN